MASTNTVPHEEKLGQKTYSCKFDGCSKLFKRKYRLEIHVRSHTGERPYVCDFVGCKNSYSRLQHLTRHIDRVHRKGFKDHLKVRCQVCQLELANRSCLKKHKASFHGNPPSFYTVGYKCPHEGCNETFHKKKQLVTHRLKHTPHIALAIKCHSCPHEGCNKTFTFPNKLRQHLKVHQGYPCDSEGCCQVFPNWSTLRKHKAKDHAPIHSCKICNAVFKQKSNLTQHIKIHATSRQPLTCPKEKCGRIFFYKKNVDQHVKEFHEGEKINRKRRKRKTPDIHLKPKVAKKRSMAARLCGIDDEGDLNLDIKLNTPDPSQVMEVSAVNIDATIIETQPLTLAQTANITMSESTTRNEESSTIISSGLCNQCVGKESRHCKELCHLTQSLKADPRVPIVLEN